MSRRRQPPPAVTGDGSPIFLISIRPQYAYQILRGVKRFELRRSVGSPIPKGSVMVVYASGSVRAIVGEFRVVRVIEGTAEQVWREVMKHPSPGVGLDAWPYIRGAERAVALEVGDPVVYPRRVTLEELRRIIPGWMPPLSYKQLREGDPTYELVIKPLRRLAGLQT
jgi:predicted transcriptional regulator